MSTQRPSLALQSAAERGVLITEAAARLRLAELIVEKDFWVGWLLGRLFAMRAVEGQLQFKGGTSLSMVFGAVQRFSEDLDLAINYLASRYARASAHTVLLDGVATVRASVELPANPLGRYVNLDAAFEEGNRLPSVSALRIGRLPVPAFLCNWLLDLGMAHLQSSTEYNAAADVIKQVHSRNNFLSVNFE